MGKSLIKAFPYYVFKIGEKMEEFDYMSLLNEETTQEQYYDYLEQHKSNVIKGGNWFIENMPELFTQLKINQDDFLSILGSHDESKYGNSEFNAYAQYFYGKDKTERVKREFDLAWLHHQHVNPHHWQYWVLINDKDGTNALPMTNLYILEMICDWWAFSWNAHNLKEIFKWYDSHKENIIFAEKTRKTVEYILETLKKRLEEN